MGSMVAVGVMVVGAYLAADQQLYAAEHDRRPRLRALADEGAGALDDVVGLH
jgi:hypothetical protein